MKVSEQEFIDSWNRNGSAAKVAEETGLGLRAVYRRRKRIEAKHDTILRSDHPSSPTFTFREHSPRVDCELWNGTILVASDAHYWPGVVSPAHEAFVSLTEELRPQMIGSKNGVMLRLYSLASAVHSA